MYLVVFRSRKRADIDAAAYEADAVRMEELAQAQPGFLSFRSYVAEDGEVVALSEWESEAVAHDWGRQHEHSILQHKGRESYYASYTLYACKNPIIHEFTAQEEA